MHIMLSAQKLLLLLVAAVNGVLLGNYVTSAFHRIPLNKPINGLSRTTGMKPHCAVCKHELRYYEYLPVLSWIFSAGSCNYCGASISWLYTVLEVLMMFLSLGLYALFDMSVLYVFSALFVASFVLYITLLIVHKVSYPKALYLLFVTGLIFIVSSWYI